MPGATLYFRARAMDSAGNWEAAHSQADAFTSFYTWAIQGVIYDHTARPLAGALAPLAAGGFEPQPSDASGAYAGYGAGQSSYPVSWQKVGYDSLPATSFSVAQDALQDAYLAPAGSLLLDGGFESGSLAVSPWQAGGALPVAIAAAQRHSGGYGAALGYADPGTPVTLPVEGRLSQAVTIPLSATHPVLSFLYRLERVTPASGTLFELQVGATPVFSTSQDSGGWAHHWLDLAPWAGQAVTLTSRSTSRQGCRRRLPPGRGEPGAGRPRPVGAPRRSTPRAARPAGNLPGELWQPQPAAGLGVTLTDLLPAGLLFHSASTQPGAAEPLPAVGYRRPACRERPIYAAHHRHRGAYRHPGAEPGQYAAGGFVRTRAGERRQHDRGDGLYRLPAVPAGGR